MSLLKFAKLPLHKGLATTFFRNLTTVSQKTVLPQILHVINNNNHWIWQKQDSFKLPINNIQPIKLPNNLLWLPINEPEKINTVIETPPTVNDETKQAARLIIIRRKKMKKHKLKKLRKKMKYVWAKLRQRREMKKEKLFQAELMQECKAGEAFSAETYVAERLELFNEVPIPKLWKGRRLPEFIIREKLGLPPK